MPFPVPSLPIGKPQNTGMPVTENLHPRKGPYAAAVMRETNSSGFRAYSVHASRLLQHHQRFSKSRGPRSCFASRSARKTPKLFSAHPLMSSWIYSRRKTQVGLLSRHFHFLDAGSFGANSECVKDQQHYRGPALADLQTGAQIPLWPQEKRQFSRNFKGKI